MLQITLDLDSGKATAATGSIILAGVSVPVLINCIRAGVASSPGASPVFEIGLGTDAAPPVPLAYLGVFTGENETSFIGLLDANDTRLVAFMASKASVAVNVELRWTVGDVTQGCPHFAVNVQPPIITPGAATEGGPVYLTLAQMDARYALIGVSQIPDRSADNVLRTVVIDAEGKLAYEV